MSLVSTYVQSTSGKWYKNPVIRGDGWFICWDDDEPIELVVTDNPDRKDSIEIILQELNLRGWKVWRKGKVEGCGMRYFSGTLIPSVHCWLIQDHGPTDAILVGNDIEEPVNDRVEYPNGRITS